MRLRFPFAGGLLASALALACQPAAAQQGGYAYNPYAPQQGQPQQAYAPQGQYAPQQVAPPAAPAQPAPAAYGQQAYPAAPGYAAQGYAPQAGSYPGIVAPAAAGPYARTAQAPGAAQSLPTPTESLGQAPAQQSAPSTMSGPMNAQHSYPASNQPATSAPAMAAYATAQANGASCNCNQSAPVANWQGYMPASTGGCATGDCASTGAYGCSDNYYASGSCATNGYYASADCAGTGRQRQWFVGLYGLYMGRDRPGTVTSTVLVDGAPAGNYYPQPGTDVFFANTEADVGFTGGAEIRFGSTFGCATDPCGCATYQPFAWELGYWALSEDSSFGEITDTFGGTTRMYGMINYAGLEYDRDGGGGAYGYRPVNDYYDYQVPIDSTSTNDIRVLAVRVTQTFEVQNLELNFWRFGAPAAGVATNACGGAGFGGGGFGGGQCGAAQCGAGSYGCNAAAYDACGCNSYTCAAPARRTRFSMSGLAGVRYLKMDETFRNAVFFTLDDGTGTVVGGEPGAYPGSMPADDNVLFHDIEVTNDLLGFQLGCNMNCQVACKWALFCDTNFGIYGNDIDAYQRVFSPGGGVVRFVGSGGDAAVRSSKTDVAFLGEARCGVGYQISPRCRLTSAYRAIAISGVALAPSQIQTPVNEAAFGRIKSNDSIVIHGFQGGVEFKY